jgi:DNA modification methylase
MSLILADARRIPLVDGCVQCCVSSPPYFGLRDYGIGGQIGLEPSPEAYVAALVGVYREVWRVLADDGVAWLNLGDSYAHSTDQMPPQRGVLDDARRKAVFNGNTSRREHGLKPKDMIGIPWRVAFALQADGWYLRSDIIWAKPNPMPESVTDRPTKAHEYVFLLSKSERYYYNADALREPHQGGVSGGRQYAQAKGLQLEKRNPNGQPNGQGHNMYGLDHPNGRNARSVWRISTQSYDGAHFATMPEKLAERCILAGSRPGDLVFDPFGGSGTTVRVARRFNRRGVMLDMNPAYLTLSRARTARVQIELFAGVG